MQRVLTSWLALCIVLFLCMETNCDDEEPPPADGEPPQGGSGGIGEDPATVATTPVAFDFSRFITKGHEYKEFYKGLPPGNGFIYDRLKLSAKQFLSEKYKNRIRPKWHPAWQDYCDPYHCEDYHKAACGMNNRTKTFQWFRSGCHLIMNNRCARYRGHLKYKPVANTWCISYAYQLRTDCPDDCPDILDPLCAESRTTGRVVLFKNRCFFKKKNCDIVIGVDLNEFVEAEVAACLT